MLFVRKVIVSSALAFVPTSILHAQENCNYSNPASPKYCSSADVQAQRDRLVALNQSLSSSGSQDDRTWQAGLTIKLQSELSQCSSNVARLTGCEFEVYRKYAEAVEGRYEGLEVGDPIEGSPLSGGGAPNQLGGATQPNDTPPAGAVENSADEPDYTSDESGENFFESDALGNDGDEEVPVGSFMIIAWLLLMAALIFRKHKGMSGVFERKVLLFGTFWAVWLVIYYFFGVIGFHGFLYFVGVPVAIWGPKATAFPIRRRLLAFYGFQGPDLEHEFDLWAAKHNAVWANFRYGAASHGQSKELEALRQLLAHQKIGKCYHGKNHYAFECGACEVEGCADVNCANYNFSDNNTCLECGHKAPIHGAY